MDLSPVLDYAKAHSLILFDHAVMTAQGVEELFTGMGNPLNNSYSVAKCFAAAAVGMLWDEGRIGLEEPVTEVLKGEFDAASPGWEQVTVRHALGHRMGIDRGFLDIDTEDIRTYGTDDFLSYAFSAPIVHPPGTHYCYSDAAYYIVSRLVERRSGQKLDEFLTRRLLNPLMVQEAAFSRCPRCHPMGATGLYIRARDMVKLGYVYCLRGAWQGRQLLSERWVRLEEEEGFNFGAAGVPGVYAKGGMRGQMLLYSPEGGYAAAWHSYCTGGAADGLMAFTCRMIAEK